MELAAPGSLEDLGALVLGEHTLELEQQPVFRGLGAGRLDEQNLDAGAAELLDQQHLMDVLPAQPVRRINQDGLDRSFGRQIADPLQPGADQLRAAEAVILDDPLVRHAVVAGPGELDQRRRLARDRLLLPLPVAGNPGVDRRCFHRQALLSGAPVRHRRRVTSATSAA